MLTLDSAPVAVVSALVTGLRSPLCYPHPVQRVTLLETHISWVLLAGDYAYKVKKPVKLGFLDFSTLALRRRFCEEELRLNRRTAPDLYEDVVPITGSAASPRVGGEGNVIEYAVRMRRFPQVDRLDARARHGLLKPADIDALAARIAQFHGAAARERRASDSRDDALRLAMDNIRLLLDQDATVVPVAALAALGGWTTHEYHALSAVRERRRREGFVRECHGDLHLGNIVMLEGAPVPFDCIEFSETLRWTDVMSDVAFVVMDLHHHGLPALAARFLDAYLARTGDYGGLAMLHFHTVYRALVRAKIAAIRAGQSPPGSAERRRALETAAGYVRLAVTLAARPRPSLTIMHGVSGSGKTTVSQRLLEKEGAIRLRSDVERKRAPGMDTTARTAAAPGKGIYAPGKRRQVYVGLEALAREVLAAGYPVLVDAAFLAREDRDRFRALALSIGCDFRIVSCEAPPAMLRERVAARAAHGRDASDAGIAVLESQLAARETLGREEAPFTTRIDTSGEA